jgi:hypothetical protein
VRSCRLGQCFEDAEHQHGLLFGAFAADGDFDLRQTSAQRQAVNQIAQRQQHCGHVRREHFAVIHICDVTALALAEADQRRRPCAARARTDSRAR